MRSPEELAAQLRAGSISVHDLSSKEFEDLTTYAFIKNVLQDDASRYKIVKFAQGEIDIVVEEQENQKKALLSGESRHFIECKKYNKNITLELIGKAYCAAVRYQPLTLIVVSQKRFDPQALQYAFELFRTTMEDSRYRFNTLFQRKSLEELFGLHEPAAGNQRQAAENSNVKAPLSDEQIKLLDWQVYLRSAFAETLLMAKDATTVRHVHGQPEDQVIFGLRLAPVYRDVRLALEVEFGNEVSSTVLRPATRVAQHDPSTSDSVAAAVRLSVPLRTFIEALKEKAENICIAAHVGGSTSRFPLPALPSFDLQAVQSLVPDLRRETREDILKCLNDRFPPRIILIYGPGGVGKSHLIERIAQSERASRHRKTIYCLARSGDDYHVIRRFLMTILFPFEHSNDLAGPSYNVAYEILNLNATDVSENKKRSILDFVISGQSTEIDLDFLLYVTTRLLLQQNQGVFLVIADAHHLSDRAVIVIEALLMNIAEIGWGDFQIVFEYRNQSADSVNPINSFVENVRDRFPALIMNRELEEVGYEKLRRAIKEKTDASPIVNDFATRLFETAGGNCLFIDHVIRRCVNQGKIEVSENNQWLIHDLPDLTVPAAAGPNGFLRSFLHQLAKRSGAKRGRAFSEFLALAAILDAPPSFDEFASMTGCTRQTRRWLQRIVQSEHILRMGSDTRLDWCHSFMRAAAYDAFVTTDNCSDVLEAYRDQLDTTNYASAMDCGRIAFALNDFQLAAEDFNHAFEVACRSSNFEQQRCALLNLSEVLERISGLASLTQLVEVYSNLYWSEENAGSREQATYYAERVLDLLAQVSGTDPDGISPEGHTRAEMLHHVWHLATTRPDIPRVEALAPEVIRTRKTAESFTKANDRFAILCTYVCLPNHAHTLWYLAAQRVAGVGDPDLHAVLLETLGNLYASCDPERALRLHEAAALDAHSWRQWVHNELSCLKISCQLNKGVDSARLHNLEETVNRLGMGGLVSKLHLVRGVAAGYAGSWDKAIAYFQNAERRAVLHNDRAAQADAANNLAVASTATGNADAAGPLIRRAWDVLRTAWNTRERVATVARDFAVDARKQLAFVPSANLRQGQRTRSVFTCVSPKDQRQRGHDQGELSDPAW